MRDKKKIREKALKNLVISLWVGAIWDWILVVIILFFPGLLSLFKIPYPKEMMYFRFSALPLFTLPFFYIQAALNPLKEKAILIGTLIARFSGFLFFLIHYIFFKEPFFFFVFGIIDLFFFSWHYLFIIKAKIFNKSALEAH